MTAAMYTRFLYNKSDHQIMRMLSHVSEKILAKFSIVWNSPDKIGS